MRQTSLYTEHKKSKAKMVEYNGWEMPISYKGIIKEHLAVRNKAGIFDVSHMGIIDVSGRDALGLLQYLTINDVSSLSEYQSQYTMMLNVQGEILDDMIITKMNNFYRVVVNCSNFQKIWDWLLENQCSYEVKFIHNTDLSMLAVQGPESRDIVEKVFDIDLKMHSFTVKVIDYKSKELVVSRTGYTGENGYELFVPNEFASDIWQQFIDLGVAPIGLGARDTLRIEAGFPLYGHEIYGAITPFDIGYKWIVKTGINYIGESVLNKASHITRLYGVLFDDRVIPRQNCKADNNLGEITSGTFSPFLKKSIALFLANKNFVDGDSVSFTIRNKSVLGKIVKLPFLKKSKKSS